MVIYYSRAETGQGHAHMNFGSSGQGEIRINFWHSHSTENQQSGARIRPTGVLSGYGLATNDLFRSPWTPTPHPSP